MAGGAAAAAVALGLGLTPAWASGGGPYEAILCHCRSQAEAQSLQAAAERLGYTAVIQVIHPNDVEVELVNGLATKADADRFCQREQPKLSQAGLHCHTEQEMHGIVAAWHHTGRTGGAPVPAPSRTVTPPAPPTTTTTTSRPAPGAVHGPRPAGGTVPAPDGAGHKRHHGEHRQNPDQPDRTGRDDHPDTGGDHRGGDWGGFLWWRRPVPTWWGSWL